MLRSLAKYNQRKATKQLNIKEQIIILHGWWQKKLICQQLLFVMYFYIIGSKIIGAFTFDDCFNISVEIIFFFLNGSQTRFQLFIASYSANIAYCPHCLKNFQTAK